MDPNTPRKCSLIYSEIWRGSIFFAPKTWCFAGMAVMLRSPFAKRFSNPTALNFLLRSSQYVTSFSISISNLFVISFYFRFCNLCWLLQRELHSRNRQAMELIAKGWSALKEVDRVIDYCELNDRRLIPLLRVIVLNSLMFWFSLPKTLFGCSSDRNVSLSNYLKYLLH